MTDPEPLSEQPTPVSQEDLHQVLGRAIDCVHRAHEAALRHDWELTRTLTQGAVRELEAAHRGIKEQKAHS